MKLRTLVSFLVTCLLLALLWNLSSCEEDEVKPPPTIDAFSPEKGFEGTTIIITGKNFAKVTTNNVVTLNGTATTVTAATPTTLTISVPVGATSGKISVTTPDGEATSATDFTVLFPSTITSFSPTAAGAGISVTITGTNFSSVPSENIVKFNNTVASVTSASPTSIVATVPDGATTGKITVLVNGVTSESATNFTVLFPPSITSFTPASAPAGTAITITGTNFSTTPANNTVKFNNTVAVVTSSTATQIKTTVPAGTTSGKISVAVGGLTATSTTDFTFLQTPTIASFSPLWGPAGTTVTIVGTHFATFPANNIVKFNGIAATVSTASSTQLTVLVPSGATTGKISVAVSDVTAQSAESFQVGCADVTITNVTITGITGNTFSFTYELKNIGTIPMELSRMFLQNYVSTDAAYGGGDVGAGGLGDFGSSEPLLQPNATRVKTASVQSSSINITTHPYLIIQLLSSAQPATVECNTTNNERIKLIALDIPRNGLVAYWPFSGNANDAGGNNLNGTVTGATLTTDRFGLSNRAYSFDGSGDFIDVGNPAALRITNNISIGVWVKKTAFQDGLVILQKKATTASGSEGYTINLSSTGNGDPFYTIRIEYPGSGDTGLNFAGAAPFSANEWVFFAFTLSGTNAKFYKNGTEVFSVNNHQPLTASAGGNFVIGRATGGGFDFNGLIDDITVYNRVLSAAEITQLYNQTVSKH